MHQMYIAISCCLFLYEAQGLRLTNDRLDLKRDECNLEKVRWGMFIDGKDAHRGEDAYGQAFSNRMQQGLDLILNASNDEEISVERILYFQSIVCGKPFRNPNSKNMVELPCLHGVHDTDFKRNILADLPAEIVDVHYLEDAEGRQTLDWMGVRNGLSMDDIKTHMKHMIDTYNKVKIGKTSSQPSSKDKMIALAKFLRSLAWLHPFEDCNGRTRNLLLQKELRRLDLGCGAMMFNNNADIYVSTTETYVAKIEEGLSILSRAIKSDMNPWAQDNVAKQAHITKFPVSEQLKTCVEKFQRNQKSVDLYSVLEQDHIRTID